MCSTPEKWQDLFCLAHEMAERFVFGCGWALGARLMHIRAGWQHAIASAQQSIVQAGAYSWQLMSNSWTAAGPPFGPKPQDCTAYMRKACTPDSNISRSMLFYGLESFPRPPEVKGGALPNLMRDLAAFLLVGGPWHFFAQSVR